MNSKLALLLKIINAAILILSRIVQVACVSTISYVLESPTIALLGGVLLGFMWIRRDVQE